MSQIEVGARKFELRLTERDRHLCGLLAVARILSTEQIGALAYPERSSKNLQKRLLLLSGIGKGATGNPPYLERLPHRTFAGDRIFAWRLTPDGWHVASRVMLEMPRPAPKGDLSAAFLDHTIGLNELFVRLHAAPIQMRLRELAAITAGQANPELAYERAKARLFARVGPAPFRWLPGDMVRLPWKEYVPRDDRSQDRVILPDAVLELPSKGRRIFLEYETGAHPIQSQAEEKTGATMSKIYRYCSFVFAPARKHHRESWYESHYPDGLKPEVLFLVPTRGRAKSIVEAYDDWARGNGMTGFRIVASTVEDASNTFLAELGCEPFQPPVRLPLSVNDLNLLVAFFNDALRKVKELGLLVRAHGETAPDLPHGSPAVSALLKRLKAAAR